MKDRYGEERHFYIMHDNCVIDSVKLRSICKIVTGESVEYSNIDILDRFALEKCKWVRTITSELSLFNLVNAIKAKDKTGVVFLIYTFNKNCTFFDARKLADNIDKMINDGINLDEVFNLSTPINKLIVKN